MEKITTEKPREILRAFQITKRYGSKCVLDNVSFSVFRGEYIAITGKSGAGKSTLLSILGALDFQSSGTVFFNGEAVSKRKSRKYRKEHVGFVFQDSCLIDEFTAYENILSSVKISKSGEDPMKYLELTGLADKRNSYPEKLSGGEARRISLARALSKKPEILLLDEPTEGLDENTGYEIIRLTKDMCRKFGTTVIIVTHNTAFSKLADRRLHLENGILTEEGGDD